MVLPSIRCSCFLILASTGLWFTANAESFRPIINPNGGHKSTVKRIPITSAPRTTTLATTFRPLTTISATLRAQKLTTKSRLLPSITTRQPSIKPKDNVNSDSKDTPVAEAWYADFNHLRRRRRPYFGNKYFPNTPYNGPFGYSSSSRVRRRPIPRPYYSHPYFGYNAPYEDYRFETDFLEPSSFIGPKPQKTKSPISDTSVKDYSGVVDTDIGQFYDPSSATFHVGTGYKSYDSSSATGSEYYNSGKGSSAIATSGTGTSTGTGSGSGGSYDYVTDNDDGYKFTAVKSHTKGKGTRAPTKSKNTRYKYNTYATDNDAYKHSNEESSGYGTSANGGHSSDSDDFNSSLDQDSNGQLKFNLFPLNPTKNVVYQTAPKAPKSKPTKTTTYAPPIKISDSSIDILTKPLGSATFNLNLSPGTVYQPPSFNYNPIGANYKPIQQIQALQPAIQPIPIQPPATNYGIPIIAPINTYSYPNPYQNQLNVYPANGQQHYLSPHGNEYATNYLGRFAEPPSLGKQQLSETDVNYSSNQQSSYDATPKARPTKRNKTPVKVNSKRVTTKSPTVSLNADEELTDNNDSNDYIGESYSYFKTIPQPTLPNAYDQEEFHSTSKNKRKSQHRLNNPYFQDNERHRSTTRKPTVTLRIPDEDYVDDLVKVVHTTKRPKKKLSKSTPSHTLDTEDLREAYDSDIAYIPKTKQGSKTHNRYNNNQSGDYDVEDDEENYEDYDNDRVSHINSKEHKQTPEKDLNSEQSAHSSSYWDKDSSIYKQYGIRARNDHFQLNNRFRSDTTVNGFRPIRGEDRSDVFAENPTDGKGQYLHDIGIVAEGSHSTALRTASTARTVTVTTPKTTTLYVWDGKSLPKNHKIL